MQTMPFGGYGLNISVLLVSIMLAIGGIALGLGYALNEKKFKEFGRNEIFQSLVNGALVGGFLLLFTSGGLVGSLVNSLALARGTSISCNTFLQYNAAICFAYNYLVGPAPYRYLGTQHSSILSSVSLIIAGLVSLYAALGIFRSFLGPVLAQIQSAVQMLGAAAVSVTVQASVLVFIAASALTILLPLGLVLRSFYPSRKAGSFLIALTIGLYVVLPLTYLMNASLVSQYSLLANQTSLSTLSANLNAIESSTLSYAGQGDNATGIVAELSNIGSGIAVRLSNLISYLFSAIAYFIVSTFVLPAFSLMLTAISIRELSELLGAGNFFGKLSLL